MLNYGARSCTFQLFLQEWERLNDRFICFGDLKTTGLKGSVWEKTFGASQQRSKLGNTVFVQTIYCWSVNGPMIKLQVSQYPMIHGIKVGWYKHNSHRFCVTELSQNSEDNLVMRIETNRSVTEQAWRSKQHNYVLVDFLNKNAFIFCFHHLK